MDATELLSKADTHCTIMAIDGLDGAGKSTLAEYIKRQVESEDTSELYAHLKRRPRVKVLPILGEDGYFYDRLQELEGENTKEDNGVNVSDITLAQAVLDATNRTMHIVVPELSHYYDLIILDRSRASFNAYQLHMQQLGEYRQAWLNSIQKDYELLGAVKVIYLSASSDLRRKLLTARSAMDDLDRMSLEYEPALIDGMNEYFGVLDAKYNPADTDDETAPKNLIVDMDLLFKSTNDNQQRLRAIYQAFISNWMFRVAASVVIRSLTTVQ